MATVRDRIINALEILQVIAGGETPSAADISSCLTSLNGMLSSWSTERLSVPHHVREEFPLVSSQQSYSMGPSGNFDTTRPIRIEHVAIKEGTSEISEIPIKILTIEEWARIQIKGTGSSIPTSVFPEYGHTLVTLNFWPVPTEVKSIVLHSWKPLSGFTNVNDTVSLAPGYEEAIDFNLALRLAPKFGKSVSGEALAIAERSFGNIKRVNSKPIYLRCDLGAVGRKSTFDYRTGE